MLQGWSSMVHDHMEVLLPAAGSVETDMTDLGVHGLEERCERRITYVQWVKALNFCHRKPGACGPVRHWWSTERG